MFKQELKKYKNKLKLWRILHPQYNGGEIFFWGCTFCEKWEKDSCPKIRNNNHSVVLMYKEETGEVGYKTEKHYVYYPTRFYVYKHGWICLEWIKYV